MPTLPRDREMLDKTGEEGYYACARCADTRNHPALTDYTCPNCGHARACGPLAWEYGFAGDLAQIHPESVRGKDTPHVNGPHALSV